MFVNMLSWVIGAWACVHIQIIENTKHIIFKYIIYKLYMSYNVILR